MGHTPDTHALAPDFGMQHFLPRRIAGRQLKMDWSVQCTSAVGTRPTRSSMSTCFEGGWHSASPFICGGSDSRQGLWAHWRHLRSDSTGAGSEWVGGLAESVPSSRRSPMRNVASRCRTRLSCLSHSTCVAPSRALCRADVMAMHVLGLRGVCASAAGIREAARRVARRLARPSSRVRRAADRRATMRARAGPARCACGDTCK